MPAAGCDDVARFLAYAWLRPESVLWDVILSRRLHALRAPSPALDFGCGDGAFQFLHLGGEFNETHDLFCEADPAHAEGNDLYGSRQAGTQPVVAKPAAAGVRCGADANRRSLRQARRLGLYRELCVLDGNARQPWQTAAFPSAFSNILYWLVSPERALAELARAIAPGGTLTLAVLTEDFPRHSLTGNDAGRAIPWRRALAYGRWDCYRAFYTEAALTALAAAAGFRVEHTGRCLAPLTVRLWDIGLRPLAPQLIRMANALAPETRLGIKREWCGSLQPVLTGLVAEETGPVADGGLLLAVLRRV